MAYLDDLINTVHEETGATFFIISHNIESVKRTAHNLGLLFRSKFVGFGTKEEMTTSKVPVIEQFLAGRPEGPISMDEMADEARKRTRTSTAHHLAGVDATRAHGTAGRLSPSHRTDGPDRGFRRSSAREFVDRQPVNPGLVL